MLFCLRNSNKIEEGVNLNKIDELGFSVGGHFAASLGVDYEFVLIENKQETVLRRNFMILINHFVNFIDDISHIE